MERTMTKERLYRVMRKSYHDQGCREENIICEDMLYCGYDRAEALRSYYASEPTDYYRGPGNRNRRTVFDVLDINTVDDDRPDLAEWHDDEEF